MEISQKKIYTCLLLVTFFTIPLAQATTNSSIESTAPNDALVFLEEVLQLDVSRYDVTLRSNSFDVYGPPQTPSVIVQENVYYTLELEGSTVDAIFAFKNGTFAWCNIYVKAGSPIYVESQPDTDIDKAKGVIERFQNFTEVPDFQLMKDLLSTFDKVENSVKTIGSMNLEINKDSADIRFKWSNIYSGINTTTLNIRFLNGNIRSFTNSLCLTTVGGTEVNFSKEEAINIAMEHAKSFSWKVGSESDDQVEIKDFKILDNPVKAELSMQPREAMTLYPYWYVELYLDKVYPGSVSSIHVGFWADTGAINYIQAMSYGRGVNLDIPETLDSILSVTSNPELIELEATKLLSKDPNRTTTITLEVIIVTIFTVAISISIISFWMLRKRK